MVKIELGKWDSIWIVVLISLVGFGFVYAFGSSDPVVMGHSGAEMEGVCLSDGTNCELTMEYVNSLVTYGACGWYDGQVCPIENGSSLLLAGYSSTQVKCCGRTAATCEESSWATYNTYCSASGQCGWVSGVWTYDQRRTVTDCEIEYRTITGATCREYKGSCPEGHSCNNGVCEIWFGV